MRREIGVCGKCGGTVNLLRQGRPGVCEDCGATEKQKEIKKNLPKLEMVEEIRGPILLQE